MGTQTPRIIQSYIPQKIMKQRLEKRVSLPHGFIRPAVNFPLRVQHSESAEPMEVRGTDILHLADLKSFEAAEHLKQILAARGGSDEAQAFLKRRQNADLALLEERFAQPPEIPDEFGQYVVPFTTAEEFSEADIGNKGLNLLRLHRLGYPIPAFVIIKSSFREVFAINWNKIFDHALKLLEWLTQKKFNDSHSPLLFSIRSGPGENLPGVLTSYANMGATQTTFPALVSFYGEEVATDIFIHNLMTLILDSDPQQYRPWLQRVATPYPQTLERKAALLEKLLGIASASRFVTFCRPDSHLGHFIGRISGAYRSNLETIRSLSRKPRTPNFSIIIQEMIVGKAGEGSYSGVFFSLDPKRGGCPQLVIAENSFGEDVMTGEMPSSAIIRTLRLAEDSGQVPPAEIVANKPALMFLQDIFCSPVRVELTVQRGVLALLQANPAVLNGPVVLAYTVQKYLDGKISAAQVLELIEPFHVRQLYADEIVSKDRLTMVARGTSILSKFDVCGKAYFSNEAALAAKAKGEKVILIKELFRPGDVSTGIEVDGIISLSQTGIHASTLARNHGLPVIIDVKDFNGQKIVIKDDKISLPVSGKIFEIEEGDAIALSSEEGALYVGEAIALPSELSQEAKSDFEVYQGIVLRTDAEEITSLAGLTNAISFLSFIDRQDKVSQIVNAWFESRFEEVTDFFAATDVGKHLLRLNMFKTLSKDNKIALVRLILIKNEPNSRSFGTFILGRLVLAVQQEAGDAGLKEFLDGFAEAEQSFLREEVIKAKQYLEISRVPEKRPDQPETLRIERDDFIENLARRIGSERLAGLTLEQIINLRRFWDLDPDPLHKPHKVIAAALRKTGIGIR